MNIVIAGAGKVGYSLARQLSKENHDVTVIDCKPERIEYVTSNLDVFAVLGNGASFEIQKSAGVENAHLLIAATSMDEVNILCCIVAKKLGVPHTIARVRNPDYTKQVLFLRDELGLSMSINPEQATAEEISRVLRFPSATKVEPFAKGAAEMVELRIPDGSPLCGMTISDIHPKYKAKVLISVVERNGRAIIPGGDFALKAGDRISIVGSPREQSRFSQLVSMKKDKAVRNVLIIGAGKVTVYLARQLLDMGMRVKIIEQDREKCLQIKNHLEKATVVCGDGTKPDILMEEGLSQADAVVALTGMDESNIIIAVYAKTVSGGEVIAKVNESHFDPVLEKTGIDVTVQTAGVTVQRIVHYVRAMENTKSSTMETLYLLNDGKVEAIQFKVNGDSHLGVPIKDLPLRPGVQISAILREGKCLIPGGNDQIRNRDDVIVVTTLHDIGQLSDIFER